MTGQAIATSFVEPRGTIRSVIAGTIGREVAGMAGSLTASQVPTGGGPDSSPLAKGQIGYLVASSDEIVLYRAKRGAFRPKPTEEAVASAPRAAVATAAVERKKLAGVLEIAFADGSTWTFEVPKIYLGSADDVARALTT